MMKNWKKIAILGIVLVVFAAAFIYLSSVQDKLKNDEDSDSKTGEEVDLISFTKDDMVKIILEHGDSTIVLTREEKEVEKEQTKDDGTTETVKETVKYWVTPDFDVDSSKVDSIASAGETVTTKRLIDENPQDVSIYGLDDPYTVTFVSGDGKEESIEIGDITPTQDSYYVRKSGDKAVYTIPSYKGETLRYGKLDLMNRNLHMDDEVTADDLTALAFERNGEPVFEAFKDSSGQWNYSKPLKRKVDASQFPKFMNWIAAFKVSEYVEENPSDLAKYGLDNPKYVFRYTLNGKEYTLKLGSKSNTKYYAQMEGNPAVFNVSASDLNFVDLPLIDLVDRFVYIPSIYDVEKLVIEIDNRVDTLVINANKDDPDKEEFYINGQKIEDDTTESLFRGYYQGAIGITGDKIDLNATPEGKAEIRLTYTMREANPDKVVVVELIPTKDGNGYYLMKNGEYSGLVMSKRKLDDPDLGIRAAYNKLMEGLKK